MKYYEAVSPQYNFDDAENFKKPKFVQKAQDKIKNVGEKIKDKIKDAADKLNPEDALMLPLVPFKMAMINALKEKGIKPKNNHIGTVAKLFVQEVVKKGRNNYVEHLTDEEKSSLKEVGPEAIKAGEKIAAGDYEGGIKALVKAIVDYFKKVDNKKKSKEATADEMNHNLDAESGITKMAEEQTPEEIAQAVTGGTTSSGKTMSNKTLLILLGLVVVVFIASRKG